MSEPDEPLTTDPPRPPGTPNVDDLVGDPVPTGERTRPRTEPDDEDVTSDTVSVEPPD
jgi:hypothetical protein